jgi:hypothetical protein
MALPINITTIVVTGTYLDFSGNPIAGQVKFYTSQVLIDAAADRIIIPSTITGNLDSNGSFSVTLPTTNDVDVSPLNYTYTYEEAFPGGSTYTLSLPSSLGASVDIADIRETATLTPTFVQPVSANVWNLLPPRVTQEESDLTASGLTMLDQYQYLGILYDDNDALEAAYASYNALDAATIRLTSTRFATVLDRITDLQDYTADTYELRDTTNAGIVTGNTNSHLSLKIGSYTALSSAYATYDALTNATQTFSYSQVGSIVADLAKVMSGASGISNAYLSAYADTIRDEANRVNRLMLIGVR